jgi:hypothetical protein
MLTLSKMTLLVHLQAPLHARCRWRGGCARGTARAQCGQNDGHGEQGDPSWYYDFVSTYACTSYHDPRSLSRSQVKRTLMMTTTKDRGRIVLIRPQGHGKESSMERRT